MHDLTHLLRLSESTIRREIRAGRFPHPVEVTRGVRLWHWTDVVYWTLRANLSHRLSEGQEPPGGRQEPPGGRQEPPSEPDGGAEA